MLVSYDKSYIRGIDMRNLINKESLVNSDYIRSLVIREKDDKAIMNMLKKLGSFVDYMTIDMASKFYKVEYSTLHKVCERNIDELKRYGVRVYKKSELEKILIGQVVDLENLPNRGMKLIPPRALFVIGLLLTKSEVSEKLREEVVKIAMGEDRKYQKGLALVDAIEGKTKEKRLNGVNEYAKLVAIEEREELEGVISTLKSKASYLDKILGYDTCITTTTIADDYGMSARSFNKLLHEMKIQYKQSGVWHLYMDYKDKGYVNVTYFETKNNIVPSMKWTHKGILFLYNKLKSVGIVPIMENNPPS